MVLPLMLFGNILDSNATQPVKVKIYFYHYRRHSISIGSLHIKKIKLVPICNVKSFSVLSLTSIAALTMLH